MRKHPRVRKIARVEQDRHARPRWRTCWWRRRRAIRIYELVEDVSERCLRWFGIDRPRMKRSSGFREYRPPHPMGMKGGCSPQNTLRLKHSFRGCKLNIRKFYEGPIAPSDHGAQPNHRSICGQIGQSLPRLHRPHFTSPEVVEALSRSCGAGQLFDLRHDAVQLIDQRVVAMPAQSYD